VYHGSTTVPRDATRGLWEFYRAMDQESPARQVDRSSAEWGWYHLVLTTYGAWLSGDSRGFRTRNHREHIEGDYKKPPPEGQYKKLERHSRESLKLPPVILPSPLREVVGRALRDRMTDLGAQVIGVAVGGQHAHILAKLPKRQVRNWIGITKRHAWFTLRERGWSSKLWGKGGKIVVIRDRAHQLNVYRYIQRHKNQGAWAWMYTTRPQSPRVASRGTGAAHRAHVGNRRTPSSSRKRSNSLRSSRYACRCGESTVGRLRWLVEIRLCISSGSASRS